MRSQDNPTVPTNINNLSKNKINNNGNSNTSLASDQLQSNTLLNSSSGTSNWSKVQALKQRKSELEKLLNEKNLLLQQIQKQEAQILRDYGNLETNLNLVDGGGNSTILRRKVGTSYKLPKNLNNCKEEDDIERLLLDKKVQQDICNAAFKLANDVSISKSIRRSHKGDYEAAQQKLVVIHQNINKLKKRQSGQFKSNSLPNSTMIISSTGGCTPDQIANVHLQSTSTSSSSSAQLHGSSDTIGSSKQCNNTNFIKYGSYSSSTNNTYHPAERRNSMKSIAINSQKFDDCNGGNNLPLIDKSMKGHSSEYDINRLVPAMVTDNNRSNSSTCFSPTCTSYFCNTNNNNNNNNNHRHPGVTDGTYFGYIGGNTNNSNSNATYKYITTNKVGNFVQTDDGSFIKLSPTGSNALFQNYNLYIVNSCNDDQRLGGVEGGDVLSEKNLYTQQCGGGSRKYCNVDTISTSPSTGTGYDQHVGLGGYWRTLSNNERVWCAVDNCSGNNMVYQQQHKPKKYNATLASSLGNFELIPTKDESVDQISVSSMSSETTKRTKEKQWLETSLDGPTLRTKSTSTPDTEVSQQSTISPVYNTNSLHAHHHSHKHHKLGNRSKLSSQSMSNNSYRPNMTKLEDQSYLSHSTSVLNINSIAVDPQYNNRSMLTVLSPADHHQQHQQQISPTGGIEYHHQNPQTGIYIPSRQISPSITHSPSFRAPPARSPIIVSNKTSDIRIESPKNMTVIQQATFMPYKEITKPFEMSDFYKYSTKFRQKEAKQQHQQQQATPANPILPLMADAN